MAKKIIVIGSGFGGLAAALRLKAKGYKVTLVEKHPDLGGRARVFKKDQFIYDGGPTVITAPYLFEELFSLFNKNISNYVKIVPLDLWYRFVFNDGDINSPLMIVGEGPGQKEDEMGKPFVGDAGQLLDKMFKAININRHKTYITNVVNYRPPNNRKPEPSEINKYSIFLREHINIIDPKMLILMGSTAMEALFGQTLKISKERGKWKEIIVNQKSYQTILTFHPAYLLRQPDQKKHSWNDLKMIRKRIDELKISI